MNHNNKTLKIHDITLEITNRCNLSCKMCSIWQEREKQEIELKDIKNLILSPLFAKPIKSISLTGGEPFLHPKMDKIYKLLTFYKAKKAIRSIGIYSNGYETKLILSFLRKNKSFLQGLDLGLSLDGKRETHNFLRGKRDSWEKLMETIEKIVQQFPQVNLEIKFTISPYNFKDILYVYYFCRKNNLFFSPKFVENETKNYYHKAANASLKTAFSPKEKKEIKKSLDYVLKKEKGEKIKIIDIEVIKALQKFILFGKKIIKSCKTPRFSLFIDARKYIYPCLYMPPIANLREKDWAKGFESQQYKKILERAAQGTCPKCFSYHGFLKKFNLSKNP